MFGLLQGLLGKQMQMQQAPPTAAQLPVSGTPGPQVAEAPVPEENVIQVEDRPFPNTMREGLVRKGPFSMGQTGGNILGILGDALLIGGGRDPIYQPRLQRAREAEALIDYVDDPERALANLSQINPARAAELTDKLRERQSLQEVRDAQIREADDEYNMLTHDRALAYLGAATEKTYPAIKQVVDRWYADRGVEPLFDLPDQWDETTIASIASGGIPIAKQRELREDQRYHDAVISQDRREEFGRNYREVFGETMQTTREGMKQAGADERNVRDNQTRRDTAGRRTRPNVRFGRRPDGTRYIIR
jgi:hypothetical protein